MYMHTSRLSHHTCTHCSCLSSQVTTLALAFGETHAFEGNGLDKWGTILPVASSLTISSSFSAAAILPCNKVKIATAWVAFPVNPAGLWLEWATETCPPLTDALFKEATWDWVQDTATATTKWFDLATWDVSEVKDFSFAFSRHRDRVGGASVVDGNLKVRTFTEFAGIRSWNTSSVTSLERTWKGASAMNAYLGGLIVTKVTNMDSTFEGAESFEGADLNTWSISAATTVSHAFDGATSLTPCRRRKIANAWSSISTVFADTSTYDTDWATEKCPPLTDATFKQASWDWVQDVATGTFKWSDLGDWDVSDVKDFSYAFSNNRNEAGDSSSGGNPKISSFVGTAMSKWSTKSVTSLHRTFYNADKMDADLGKWDVSKVRSRVNGRNFSSSIKRAYYNCTLGGREMTARSCTCANPPSHVIVNPSPYKLHLKGHDPVRNFSRGGECKWSTSKRKGFPRYRFTQLGYFVSDDSAVHVVWVEEYERRPWKVGCVKGKGVVSYRCGRCGYREVGWT